MASPLPSRAGVRAAVVSAALALVVGATHGASAAGIVDELFGAGWTPGATWATAGTYTPQIVSLPGQTPQHALRLTPAVNFQSGSVSYTLPQPTSGGLDVRFVVSQWGSNPAADGITFFLRKGSNPSNATGGNGGAMGYSAEGSPPVGVPQQQGMPGGLIGVGFDLWGNYTTSRYSGTDCPSTAFQANTIAIRGPGSGLTGYCVLGQTAPGQVNFNAGGNDRTSRSRSIRITVDPSTQPSPRVRVFFAANGSGTGLSEVLSVPVPPELLAEPTFKFGLSAGTGLLNNNNEAWGLTVDSLTILPDMVITTASLPSGTVGTPYSCTTLAQSNGVAPVAFAIVGGSLPAGLTLDATGRVCGTPASEGTRRVTVSATDSRAPTASVASREYSISIADSGPPCVPVDLAARAGATTVTLTWAPNGAAGCPPPKRYEVESAYGARCTTTAPTARCAIAKGDPAVQLRYRVRALNDVGASPWSSYAAPIVDVEQTSVAHDAVVVSVAASRPGDALAVGQSRQRGGWVTRCVGRAVVSGTTHAQRVRCVLTPVARRILCARPLAMRLIVRLSMPGAPVEVTRTTVRAARRSCGPPPVAG